MKKFAILSLAAVAALTLAACGKDTTTNTTTTIENETVLNSEVPVDNLTVEDPALGNAGDNVAVDALNTSVENTTTTNTVQ